MLYMLSLWHGLLVDFYGNLTLSDCLVFPLASGKIPTHRKQHFDVGLRLFIFLYGKVHCQPLYDDLRDVISD